MTDIIQLIRALPADKRAALAKLLEPEPEPLAIIGMACRFPGGAAGQIDSPEAFWQMLSSGGTGTGPVPPERWNTDTFPGNQAAAAGGFLAQVDQFDAAFWGIAPREAEHMDPQQRLLLETAWEALERAGQPLERVAGSATGVFVGVAVGDYGRMQYQQPAAIDAYTTSGTAHSIVANRLSYALDVQGPSVAVDTACSSSLVAAHLACQSLRAGESDMALVGGVNLILSPEVTLSLAKWGMLAPDGRCKTFDASADGFARGEGCGMLVLKRLSDAQANGDPVLALICGSAVNQDGRSNGLTAPNVLAQQAVIRRALANARVQPGDVGYVETHGTGTTLGDPIEVEALAAVYGTPQPDGRPCVLGAVKANIGHLEAAAGIAGLIKTVLVLQHGSIPPQVHFQQLNPHIRLEGTRLHIPTDPLPWQTAGTPRRAGVSGFGFGGTNAHVILREKGEGRRENVHTTSSAFSPLHSHLCILPLSARSPAALHALAQQFAAYLARATAPLPHVLATVALRRTHHPHRLAVIGHSQQELAAQLADYAAQPEAAHPAVVTGSEERRGLVFVCSGQGGQWAGMGRALLAESPAFRGAVEQCDALFHPLAGWSLRAVLAGEETTLSLDDTALAQPALFAVQIGLAAYLEAWGIRPDALIGHSVGEVAAAYLGGSLSLSTALHLVYQRGRLLQQATDQGRMLAVGMAAAELAPLLHELADEVVIAAANSPTAAVLAGTPAAITAVQQQFEAWGMLCRLLPVRYAFHSPQMQPLAEELTGLLAGMQTQSPRLPVVSTVSGKPCTLFDAAYWGQNVREPVRFAEGIDWLREAGYQVFVELGPHPVLARPLSESLDAAQQRILATLRRPTDSHADPPADMLRCVGQVYTLGYPVRWNAQTHPDARHTDLPTYPWQRQRFWLPPVPEAAPALPNLPDLPDLPAPQRLIGRRVSSPLTQYTSFETLLTPDAPPFLREHGIYGQVVLPAAAGVVMALSAAQQAGMAQPHLGAGNIYAPLLLADLAGDTPRRVQTVLQRPDSGDTAYQYDIYSQPADPDGANTPWTLHVRGTLHAHSPPVGESAPSLASARQDCTATLDVAAFYAALQQRGVAFGPAFQGVTGLWGNPTHTAALGRVDMPTSLNGAAPALHPPHLDAALQIVAALLPADTGSTFLPLGWEQVRLPPALPPVLWSYLQLRQPLSPATQTSTTVTSDVWLYAEDGTAVGAFRGLMFRHAPPAAFTPASLASLASLPAEWLYRVAWEAAPLPAAVPPALAGRWLLVGAVPAALAEQVATSGAEVLTAADADRLPPDLPQTLSGVVYLPASTPDAIIEAATDSAAEVLRLVQQLTARTWQAAPRLWLVTRRAQAVNAEEEIGNLGQAGLWGLAQVVALEHPELRTTCIDTEGDDSGPLLAELAAASDETHIALRSGARLVARLLPHTIADPAPPAAASEALHLLPPANGLLDEVRLQPTPSLPEPLADDAIELAVLAAGLNFRDVLRALGEHTAAPLGGECVGRVLRVGQTVRTLAPGDTVLAIAPGSLGTRVRTPAALALRLPAPLSVPEAATLPVAYLTAHYSLHRVAHLQPGERVLIHAATGGVGLAALHLAQHAGAVVFATTSTPRKRALVQSLGVPVAHIADSRALSFVDSIRRATAEGPGAPGVDVVVNALAGDFIPAGLRLLRPGGRFLELGKAALLTPAQAGEINPAASYHPIDLSTVWQEQPAIIQEMLHDLAALLSAGQIPPLPRQLFPLAQAAAAFRQMAQAQHIGKIVLSNEHPPAPLVRPDVAYLLTGGTGALGLAVARWLVAQGARWLVLASRSVPDERAQQTIAALHAQGVHVRVQQADVSQPAAVERLLRLFAAGTPEALPPLRGIIHAAGIVDDGIVQQQTRARLAAVLAPKVAGAWHLHRATVGLPLDFFVLFSSQAALLGAAGQGSYAAANAFLDALAHHRRALGLPALSINWGPWAESGMAAQVADNNRQRWQQQGIRPMTTQQGLAALHRLLAASQQQPTAAPQVAVLPIDWAAYQSAHPTRPLLGGMHHPPPATAHAPAEPSPVVAATLAQQLAQVPPADRWHHLVQHVSNQVRRVLRFPAAAALAPRRPLHELGMDSLTAIELRNALSSSTGHTLPAALLFDYPSVAALAEYLLRLRETDSAAFLSTDQRNDTPAPPAAPAHNQGEPPESAESPESLDQLSEGAIDTMLADITTRWLDDSANER